MRRLLTIAELFYVFTNLVLLPILLPMTIGWLIKMNLLVAERLCGGRSVSAGDVSARSSRAKLLPLKFGDSFF